MDNKDQTKGKIEQAVGDLTGNDELKRDGRTDEKAGDVKGLLEDVKDKVEHLVDKAKDKLTKH